MSLFPLPALATAHSHAFQRAMRGKAQRRSAPVGSESPSQADDFWTWRGQMYAAATRMDPESTYQVAKVAYAELAAAGVRTVGEFHYLHHAPDGTPYEDRLILSHAVIRAAKECGLRISLLRCAYFRAGPGRPPEPGQRRFCDPTPDAVLRDVDDLRAFYKEDPDVVIGLAPHSVRAVPPAFFKEISDYARAHDLPIHAHVSEQPREDDECVAETGRRPAELLAELGVLSPRFVGVHGTQLLPHEAKLFGEAGAFLAVCATTERDLGDGLPDLASLREAGVRLCTGIDSHVLTDPFDDLRSLETHARLRTKKRVTFQTLTESPAEALWREGSLHGALACGFSDVGGSVLLDREHPTLALVDDADLLDAVVFSGSPALVRGVRID